MKIEMAIAILIATIDDEKAKEYPDVREAIKLGAEALRRVGDMRKSPCTTADEILPGETD